MADGLLTIADDAQFYLGVLGALQPVHRLLVCHFLTDEGLVVDLHDLVAGNQSGTLGRAVADHILHTDGVPADGELDADAREGTLQVVVGYLHILGADIDRVRIEFRQDLRHCLLHQVIDVDRIHILVVDHVQQVVQLVAARIDDIQPVAGEMVGIERTDQYAEDDRQGHPQRGKAG